MTTRRRARARTTLIQQSRAKSPAEKALIHNVAGAGKARVTREFFDLDADDQRALTDELTRRVTHNLRTQG